MSQGFINSIQVASTARVISSIADNTNPVSITNGVTSNFLTLSVPAGQWMLTGNFNMGAGGASSYYNAWISTTSATFPSPDYSFLADASVRADVVVPTRIFTFTSTTTVYLSVWIDTASQLQGQFYAIEVVSSGTGTITPGPVVATQANQETGTSITTYVSPGRQQYHVSAAKAWVVFNGTGAISIGSSYNVTSITDNAVGSYTINFTISFSSANYMPVVSGSQASNGSNITIMCNNNTTASTCTIISQPTGPGGGGAADPNVVNCCVFGDQA